MGKPASQIPRLFFGTILFYSIFPMGPNARTSSNPPHPQSFPFVSFNGHSHQSIKGHFIDRRMAATATHKSIQTFPAYWRLGFYLFILFPSF
jgi:hypothetical protein